MCLVHTNISRLIALPRHGLVLQDILDVSLPGIRVLELLGDSEKILGKPITDVNSLYEVAAAVPWAKYMREDETLSVDAILGVVPEGLTHSHFTALTVKVSSLRGSWKGYHLLANLRRRISS